MASYTRDSIYDYVRNGLKTIYPNLYITSTDEPIPANNKAIKVFEVGWYRPRQNITLDFSDSQKVITFQVDVYSNLFGGSQEDVYTMMESVEDVFNELAFRMESCVPVERANNRVSRLTARFTRQIGGGDQMPEGE